MSVILSKIITDAKNAFEEILQFVKTSGLEIHEVEQGILSKLMGLGKHLLSVFVAQQGVGDTGSKHKDVSGVERHRHDLKERQYRSIFGEIRISRIYYWSRQAGGLFPLDARLNLPENSQSYLLEKWHSLLATQGSYNEVHRTLTTLFGIDLHSNDIAENLVERASAQVDQFYENRSSTPDETKDLLVVTGDCKGIPMKKLHPVKRKHRLKKGEKPGKKKMSTVTAVYTIDRYIRTPEDVLKDIAKTDPERAQSAQERPRPHAKITRATLQGKNKAFECLANEVKRRDPLGSKCLVALIDGEKKLRALMREHFPDACVILDIYHVLEYLWKASHVFHTEGSEEAEKSTKAMLFFLLKGQLSTVVSYLQYCRQGQGLSSSKKKMLQKVVGYLEGGKECMQYHEYLAQGYPIGSGVVEGACRNLVKDRMELSGMHWTENGAEVVLGLRSIELNGFLDEYYRFRVQAERIKLYGTQEKQLELAA